MCLLKVLQLQLRLRAAQIAAVQACWHMTWLRRQPVPAETHAWSAQMVCPMDRTPLCCMLHAYMNTGSSNRPALSPHGTENHAQSYDQARLISTFAPVCRVFV